MKRYPQYRIHCPDFFEAETIGQSRRAMALNVHLVYDVKRQKIMFNSMKPFGDDTTPLTMNCQARLIEVYCAMAALAVKKLRWMKKYPSTFMASRIEPIGILNHKQVAHIVSRDEATTDKVILGKEDLRFMASKFLSPRDNNYWDKLETVEVVRIEDFVELDAHEREALLEEGRKVLATMHPKTRKDVTTYDDIDLKEVTFGPNMAWRAWALQNAHRDNPHYCRISFECNLREGRMSISWRDETKTPPPPPLKFSGNYYSKAY